MNGGSLRPYLKWAGGKRQLLDPIGRLVPSFEEYYEPFVGAGAVLFSLHPEKAVINDTNTELCMTYETVRDDVDGLIELLKNHSEMHRLRGGEYFYEVRAMDRDQNFRNIGKTERAARTIYLNKTCYNGLYRVNSDGYFNAPFGKYRNPSIFEEEVLRAVSEYLNKNDVKILNGDFSDAVEDALRGGGQRFVYFDPPYDSLHNSGFTGYQAGGFSRDDQIRLRDLMVKLTENGVKCLLSNAATEFIVTIYSEIPEFHIDYVEATRMINSVSTGRGKVPEVLVRNW